MKRILSNSFTAFSDNKCDTVTCFCVCATCRPNNAKLRLGQRIILFIEFPLGIICLNFLLQYFTFCSNRNDLMDLRAISVRSNVNNVKSIHTLARIICFSHNCIAAGVGNFRFKLCQICQNKFYCNFQKNIFLECKSLSNKYTSIKCFLSSINFLL